MMAIRDILLYPHPVLREPCKPLDAAQLASADIQTLIADMVETLYHHTGAVGLAAPQVGAPVQILVMDSTAKTTRDRLFVLVNPVLTQQSQWKFSREGCLSFPDYLVTVKRARKTTVDFLTPTGIPQIESFREFEAIIVQHEWDHLQGILFLDRLRNIDTDLIHRR